MRALLSRFFLILTWSPGKIRFSGCSLAHNAFWRKFADSVKSGCVSRELKTTKVISRRAGLFKNFARQKLGSARGSHASAGVALAQIAIRESKTSRWLASAVIAF